MHFHKISISCSDQEKLLQIIFFSHLSFQIIRLAKQAKKNCLERSLWFSTDTSANQVQCLACHTTDQLEGLRKGKKF